MRFLSGQRVSVSKGFKYEPGEEYVEEKDVVIPPPNPDTPERAHIFESYGPTADDCSVLRLMDGKPSGTARERFMAKHNEVEALPEN